MLKILHTADWHLGHRLHGISRKNEHQAFLEWLLVQIEQTEADALIIAGDIFDSANPGAESQSVFYNFLVRARQCSASLDMIIIGGNHDSASRLDAPSEILQSLGISIIGGLTRLENGDIDWHRLVIPLTDKDAEIRAVCGAMPFIRNADLPVLNTQETAENDPLIAGVAQLYEQLFQQMQDYKKVAGLDAAVRGIVTGHCYMVGTELSELSERRILGGNQHALPANIFNEAVDYVALGHLHKAQRVQTSQNTLIQYSGSPIPLSFAERNYRHQIRLLELDKDSRETTEITIPRTVRMIRIPHNDYVQLDELAALIAQQEFETIENTTLEQQVYPILEICIELHKPEPGLRQQIETMLSGLAVRLLKISMHYPGRGEALATQKPQIKLEELHPEDVFAQCYQRSFAQPVPDDMNRLFQHLLESVEEQQ